MILITARNVHRALPLGVYLLKREGREVKSRPGPAGDTVLEHPEPVTTEYTLPHERVLFWPQRDANPFFHFFESLWMLAGRNDVAWISHYNRRMRSFSDDGTTLHGAYGHRWLKTFTPGLMWSLMTGQLHTRVSTNQILTIIEMLKADPDSRRAVLQMWHAPYDLGVPSRDVCCNTHAYFKLRRGVLRMTICCRSNDMIWGAYGANAVHFSVLQEYIADKLGAGVGTLTQLSDSFHAYMSIWERVENLDHAKDEQCPYALSEVRPFPLGAGDPQWDVDLQQLFVAPWGRFQTPFFVHVVSPLWAAWEAYKDHSIEGAVAHAEACKATDWARAAREWLLRRTLVQWQL